MKKENRILYSVGIFLLGCLALVALATDSGTNTMSDAYCQLFGLSPTNTAMDLDGDGLSNLQESRLGTDPFATDTDKDGWNDNVDSNPVSRAVFAWGSPQFTSDDVYRYTFPVWCSNGFKIDGTWMTNGWVADSSLSNNTGSLNIQVVREFLTNNTVLDVQLFDATNSSLFVALCDSNQTVIVSNLYGQSIVTGSQAVVTRRLAIPFASNSNFSVVRLWRGTGDITVYNSSMYIDEDGDGLDADQERQLGTSDYDADFDHDGLNDYAEVFVTHTNPLNSDSDGDGYSDYVEVMANSDPNNAQSLPVSAVSVFGTINYTGCETGKIYAVAVSSSNDWNLTRFGELTSPGAYSIADVPVLANYWIKAWRDSNGNNVRDAWEASGIYANPLYLSHPASNINITLKDVRSLPFAETFEPSWDMAGTLGSLNAQHGWSVSGTGTATVQTNTVFNGSQAAQITDASASHSFIDGRTNVWVSYRIQAVKGSSPQNIPTNMAVVFYVNTSGSLCVYSNQQSVTLPVTVPDGWNRFDIHCNFSTKRWDMRFNREPAVSNFPFYGSPSTFSILRLDGNGNTSTYMDDVQLVYENPDRDNDGYSNDEETQAGSDPDDAQSRPGVTVSGTVTYTGPQTGAVHVIAVTGSNSWDMTVGATLTNAGTYSITNVPVMTNVWIKAWRDSNANGSNEAWEAQGVYGTNPLHLVDSVSGINLTLSDADSDSDGLPDWWENKYFGNLTSSATNDPDGDGLVNSNELTRLTNPNVADTDGDGWLDGEEVTLGSNPLNSQSIPISQATVSGTVGYSGRQTGTVYVVAVTDAGSWDKTRSAALGQPGVYSLTNLPVLTNIWIKAWRDSDGDGSNGLNEASAVYSANPLYLTRSVSNLVLTLVDTDSDSDGLPDWWEIKYFGNLNQTASDDPDNDGLNNLAEYNYQTSPASADTDADGLPDGWEVTNGLDPLNPADCMSDPDGDGFGAVYEYHHNTSWTNGTNYPAATTNVTPSQKIQDVIDASPDYAIIHIQPGTYSGVGNRDLHFNGRPMILTADPGTVVLDVDGPVGIRSYSAGEDIRTVVDGLIIRNARQYAFCFGNSGLTIRNCVIENCGTGSLSGAGCYLSGSAALVENCVFYGNISSNGGAIYANNADLQLRNCTLVSNRVTGTSGSIRFGGTGKTLTVLNSIIWEEGTNPVQLVSGTANISYSCIKGGYTGTGNIANDPLVLTNGYYLNLYSPCIDAGTTNGAPLKDIERHTRTGAVDIGAWEYNASYVDSDGDGYTDAQENGISDPANAQSLPVSVVPVSGTVTYSGPQTGTVYVIAVTDSNSWDLTASATLMSDGTYGITNVPVLSNVWIKAWRDSNANGSNEAWEAQGVYGTNPLYLVSSSSNINLTLSDPDTDHDGLPDWWEYKHFGNLSYSSTDDPDGDGLPNMQEYLRGTDPLVADSGILPAGVVLAGDGFAVPPAGALSDVAVLDGAQISRTLGSWAVDGSALYAVSRRGYAEYTITPNQGDIYQFQIGIKQQTIQPGETKSYRLRFSVDGKYIERQTVDLLNGELKEVAFDTPFLNAGAHVVQVYWDNYESGISLRIEYAKLRQYPGTDNNANGMKDWVENKIALQNTVDTTGTVSCTSPVCLEGKAPHVGIMTLPGDANAQPGPDDTWFADLALNPDGDSHSYSVSFENGSRTISRTIQWKPTNLLIDTPSGLMRRGDALLLTAAPDGVTNGMSQIFVNDAEVISSSAGVAQPYVFSSNGVYVVRGLYTGTDSNNAPVSLDRTVQIEVTGVEPQTIAAMVDTERSWVRSGAWPTQAVMKLDSRISLRTDETGQVFVATSIPEERYGLVRLGENGPVLAPITVKGFNMWFMKDTYLHYDEIYDDGSFRAVTTMIMSPSLPEVWVNQRCRNAVSYEDGSRVRNFYYTDYNALGETVIVFCHPLSLAHSVCHLTDVYQGDQFIGRNY